MSVRISSSLPIYLSLSSLLFLSSARETEVWSAAPKNSDGGNDARTVASGAASCERSIRETQRRVRFSLSIYLSLSFLLSSSTSSTLALSAEKHSGAPRDAVDTRVISFMFRFARVSRNARVNANVAARRNGDDGGDCDNDDDATRLSRITDEAPRRARAFQKGLSGRGVALSRGRRPRRSSHPPRLPQRREPPPRGGRCWTVHASTSRRR